MFVSLTIAAKTDEQKTDTTSIIEKLHLPSTTKIAAEGSNIIVFTNVDSTYADLDDMDVVSLWTYNKKEGKLLKLLTTNPAGKYRELSYEYECKAKKVSVSLIPTIYSVQLNWSEDKILVQGFDFHDGFTYIISLTDGLPTIQLPCNMGVFDRTTSEEDLIVGMSYAYYRQGGRYNKIYIFDWDGNCLKHLSLKNIKSKEISR